MAALHDDMADGAARTVDDELGDHAGRSIVGLHPRPAANGQLTPRDVLVDNGYVLGFELRVGVERVHLVKVFRAGADVVRLRERLKRRQVGLCAVEEDPVARSAGDTLDRHEVIERLQSWLRLG